jgi:copper chaperone CopZ
MRRIGLQIGGMTCDLCVSAVRDALERITGASVEQLTIGGATVSFDPARTSPDELVRAVADVGYAAEVLDEGA